MFSVIYLKMLNMHAKETHETKIQIIVGITHMIEIDEPNHKNER